MRIRNKVEIVWRRSINLSDGDSVGVSPENERKLRLHQALIGQAPRRRDRIILEAGREE